MARASSGPKKVTTANQPKMMRAMRAFMGLGAAGVDESDVAVFKGLDSFKKGDAQIVGKMTGHLKVNAGFVEFVDLAA
jgi:hypothetical protein